MKERLFFEGFRGSISFPEATVVALGTVRKSDTERSREKGHYAMVVHGSQDEIGGN